MLFSWCGGVSGGVAVFWCSCDDVFVLFLWWCFFGGAVVFFAWWCFCRGVFVVVWCFGGGVVVFLWWKPFARATVALTRARSLCIITGPLDMTGFVGAATVTGCLLYGAGHALQGQVNFALHDGTIVDSPSDTQFVIWLEENQRTPGRLLPLACIEALNDCSTQQCQAGQAQHSPTKMAQRGGKNHENCPHDVP